MTDKDEMHREFWRIVQATWTREERAELRATVEAWMAARVER